MTVVPPNSLQQGTDEFIISMTDAGKRTLQPITLYFKIRILLKTAIALLDFTESSPAAGEVPNSIYYVPPDVLKNVQEEGNSQNMP